MKYSYVCLSFLVNLFELQNTNLIMHERTHKVYALLLNLHAMQQSVITLSSLMIDSKRCFKV